RNMWSHADRWHGCSAYREVLKIILERFEVKLPYRAGRDRRRTGNGTKMRLIAESLAGERGGEPVFQDISFSLGEGGGLVVTGPNGSGKSTLLRIVAGLLPPAAGLIRLEDAPAGFEGVAAACHYLGHANAMKTALTVDENLRFWRGFSGEPHLEVEEALEMVGLPE